MSENSERQDSGTGSSGSEDFLPEQTLPQVPLLAGLYANAAARSARLMVTKPQTSTALPEVAYRVDEVGVDDGQLARYQHLLGDVLTDALPAGFVHVAAFPVAMGIMARDDFPLPLLGMVHIANRVQQYRGIDFQERLGVRAWAQELRRHPKGTQVELVVEVTGSAEPGVAWRGVSTYLAKGRMLPGIPEAAETPRAGQGWFGGDAGEQSGGTESGATESDPAVSGGTESGTAESSALPEPNARWRLGADTGRAYADVSGDRNPIHLGALPAKAFGFGRAIAHGMYTAARALAAATPDRPDAFTWEVAFGKPVLLPGTVSFAARDIPGTAGEPAKPAGRTTEPTGGGTRPAGGAAAPPRGSTQFLGWNQRSGKVHFSGRVDRQH